MHMADALISPGVGGTMWVVTAGLIAHCARQVRQRVANHLVPMMGVLGAFVFAAQMINFSIPGTGSSGHLGGGMILAILLGPHAAFLVIASVLAVQALFFADGGLLALGCNIFNLGFFPSFVAYPLIYRPLARDRHGTARASVAAVVAAVVALQLGAFGVVLETRLSGISDLPFGTFLLLMQPIHLAIGIVEGVATAALVGFVARARPEAFALNGTTERPVSLKPLMAALLVAAGLVGGLLSWFASTRPDGLEWSIARATGREELPAAEGGLHQRLAALQEKLSFLPDYGFRSAEAAPESNAEDQGASWPAASAGTTVSGLVGGLLTLAMVGMVGLALRPRRAAVP